MGKLHLDWFLVLPSVFLAIISLVILSSVAPQLLVNQLVFVCVATVCFLIFSALDYEILFALNIPIYIFFILFSLLPLFIGILSRGAQRWLPFGSYTLQPSELIKPFLLVTFASIAASGVGKKIPLLFLVGLIPVLIVFFQPDLGTSMVIFVGWMSILLSRLRLKEVVILALLAFVVVLPAYQFVLHDYQRQRIQTFINPYRDPLGQGYHIIQSTIAVGSGQLIGRGLGRGTQTQLKFLPEHHTDFIFASISEELGFLGSGLVLILYACLFWRIYVISQSSPDMKTSLFCVSALALLGFQTFINIGMNIGLAPITGITLPLLSYGGSSFLSVALTLGIINSISSHLRSDTSLIIQ